MEWSIVIWFIKELISGEVWRLWTEHKQREKAQAVADAPVTKEELLQTLKDGTL